MWQQQIRNRFLNRSLNPSLGSFHFDRYFNNFRHNVRPPNPSAAACCDPSSPEAPRASVRNLCSTKTQEKYSNLIIEKIHQSRLNCCGLRPCLTWHSGQFLLESVWFGERAWTCIDHWTCNVHKSQHEQSAPVNRQTLGNILTNTSDPLFGKSSPAQHLNTAYFLMTYPI